MGSAEAPLLTALFTSLAQESTDSLVVVAQDGSIRYMNPAAGAVTGLDPDQARGSSIFDLVHPDDVERAIFDLGVHSAPGAPPGWTTYRVKAANGSWLPMQVTTAEVTDGSDRLLATYCRAADVSPTQVLFGLLRGTPTDALEPVLDMFNRKVFGSRVAIVWSDQDGLHQVGTDLPPDLAGGDDSTSTPWATCRRDAKREIAHDLSALDDARRAAADRLGLGAYWIEPVIIDGLTGHALITVWTRVGGPPPEYHSAGMNVAKDFVELILRWIEQAQRLNEAAHRDPLTGLANRKAFFDSLATGGSGAVLYCDLDRFKPVNDALGHRAGDELLRAVARRILGCVRSNDVVARIGGDEFALLCRGVTPQQAAILAERVAVAVEEPFQIEGASASVGISIGVAHAIALGDAALESADRALYRAKAQGGSAVQWPEPERADQHDLAR
jgi:diguanylate cyclase (GGDEF)-like protein/PAS domain S-box-containing protein